MGKFSRTTIESRRKGFEQFKEDYKFWMTLGPVNLLKEVQKSFPMVVEGERDELIQHLTFAAVEKYLLP